MSVPRCHFIPKEKWCDHAGPGGFMGHTCEKLDMFDIVKANMMAGRIWVPGKWGGYEPVKTAVVFTAFARYFLFMYDCIFVETKDGPAHVTAISDEGIRIETFPPGKDWDWIHIADIPKWGFVKQKTLFDRHPELSR